MSVVILLATIECDCCAKRFKVEIDTGATRPKDWTFFELIVDAVRGGHAYEGGDGCSVDGDKLRCSECTSEQDSAWIEAHPDYISSVQNGGGVWSIETYDGSKFVQRGGIKPEFDRPISDYPEAEAVAVEA